MDWFVSISARFVTQTTFGLCIMTSTTSYSLLTLNVSQGTVVYTCPVYRDCHGICILPMHTFRSSVLTFNFKLFIILTSCQKLSFVANIFLKCHFWPKSKINSCCSSIHFAGSKKNERRQVNGKLL